MNFEQVDVAEIQVAEDALEKALMTVLVVSQVSISLEVPAAHLAGIFLQREIRVKRRAAHIQMSVEPRLVEKHHVAILAFVRQLVHMRRRMTDESGSICNFLIALLTRMM